MSNIFDITKLAPQRSQDIQVASTIPKERRTSTAQSVDPEEQARLLQNYVLVEQTQWLQLPKGQHIRYKRRDGKFRKGGFVVQVIPEENKIQLINNNKPQRDPPIYWSIKLKEIEKIWKKNTGLRSEEIYSCASNSNNSQYIQEFKEKLEYLQNDIKKINIELQNIRNEHVKVVNIIRKLTNKIK
jgi:hypothetical protein